MINETLYNKTVDILVQAYFNDTLMLQECTACAVGNIVAANNGYKIVKVGENMMWQDEGKDVFYPQWANVLATPKYNFFQRFFVSNRQWFHLEKFCDSAKEEILSSGYDLPEFARIENAFEKGAIGKDKMFNGLMAVIDVLDEIHQNKDCNVTESTKSKFVKA